MSKDQEGTLCAEPPHTTHTLFDSDLLWEEDEFDGEELCSEDDGSCMQSCCCNKRILVVNRQFLTHDCVRDLQSVGVDLDSLVDDLRIRVTAQTLTIREAGRTDEVKLWDLLHCSEGDRIQSWLTNIGLVFWLTNDNRELHLSFPKQAAFRAHKNADPRMCDYMRFVMIRKGTWALAAWN